MNGAQSCDLYTFAASGSEWQRLAATGSDSLRFVPIRSRWGAFGGVRGRPGAKAKKAKGFLRKPNNPRLYVNVSLTNDNVCRNPQNVSRKRKMFAFIPFMLADSEEMQTELL